MSILLKAGADAGNNGLKLMVKGQDPIFYSEYICFIYRRAYRIVR